MNGKMQHVIVKHLVGHKLNRKVRQEGQEWESLLESVRMHGILHPPIVRVAGEYWEIVSGHRRVAAAKELGIEAMLCDVRELSDQEALELLLIENQNREEVNPVDEARIVEEMLVALLEKMEEKEALQSVAERIARSVEWVGTRQRLLDLGDEVLEALSLPREAENRLSLGAAREILEVPAEARPQAEQMVLHPEWKVSPLNAREARDCIRERVLEPFYQKQAWEEGKEKLKKAWRKNLGELLTKSEQKELIVKVEEWDAKMSNRLVEAHFVLPYEERVGEGEGKYWLQLAIRHGLTVSVFRCEHQESKAMVDAYLLRLGEESRRQAGEEAWLKAVEKSAKGEKKTEDVVAEEEGGEEEEWREEPEKMVEHSVESRAWVDLMPLRVLRQEAVKEIGHGRDEKVRENWPEWAQSMSGQDIGVILTWVIHVIKV